MIVSLFIKMNAIPHSWKRTWKFVSAYLLFLFLYSGCARDRSHQIIISIHDQKMILLEDQHKKASYSISTSKYGVGDEVGSYKTPLGHFVICKKIGEKFPKGEVFKNQKPTGEILRPNAPGRDPIVTRIFCLAGREAHNRNASKRSIYIHGTPEEKWLGVPKSYGCIRMSSADAVALDNIVGLGTEVQIINGPLK